MVIMPMTPCDQMTGTEYLGMFSLLTFTLLFVSPILKSNCNN